MSPVRAENRGYDRDHYAETRRATRAAELAAQMDPLFEREAS